MRLILASRSARRSKLLGGLGLRFTVMNGTPLNEAAVLDDISGTIEQRMEHLARRKGDAPAMAYPEAVILTADTEVAIDGELLGKPRDVDHAREMLTRLSARAHQVYTAVAVQRLVAGYCQAASEITRVTFNLLDSDTIDRYIARAEPFDKAGSYAIQGLGALLVRRIEGDYTNVVGLPLGLTARMLTAVGIRVL